MSVNLLPQATETDLKKVDSSVRGFIGLLIWFGIMIITFVVLLFNRGFEIGTVEELQSTKTSTINKIAGLGNLHDDYYTLSYKTSVLQNIKTQQYTPSVIGEYIDSKIDKKSIVQNYNFDASGNLTIQLESASYLEAVKIWNSLLQDKKIISELNLNTFSEDTAGRVQFQLKGQLNLQELYARNAK